MNIIAYIQQLEPSWKRWTAGFGLFCVASGLIVSAVKISYWIKSWNYSSHPSHRPSVRDSASQRAPAAKGAALTPTELQEIIKAAKAANAALQNIQMPAGEPDESIVEQVEEILVKFMESTKRRDLLSLNKIITSDKYEEAESQFSLMQNRVIYFLQTVKPSIISKRLASIKNGEDHLNVLRYIALLFISKKVLDQTKLNSDLTELIQAEISKHDAIK